MPKITNTVFHQLSKNLKNIDLLAVFDMIAKDKDLQKDLILMQTERLYETGNYYDGEEIITFGAQPPNRYAEFTLILKRNRGQITKHVTLKDTGAFYKSIKPIVKKNLIFMTANFDKENGNMSENVKTEKVLGFNDENMNELIQKWFLPLMRDIILTKMLNFK